MVTQEATALALLLKRAQSWQQDGNIHQARDMYFRLVENFPDTDEAHKAEERLLTMAQELEEEGKVYMAMSIYDRLATTTAPATPATRVRILSPGGRPM